ncbi:hypothetical protein OGAPHI_004651 [Ogataea philodendri]|uniref:Uncharacterized protein n=1 Tax=Ogataea philodendri TaxID=1378263 RepID=A0A9P8P3D4_9ASCO|nr:uncharacterized protein OGAPHI_004651 [Ogataea philodendri]KAH3664299.1 hypothetical protein OGAPHI_004651 [Ogataea philodendri]
MVTSDPSLDQTDPISSPMIPPPIMTSFLGTSESERAPVEETILSSSISIPGNGVTSEPVAMMILSALRTASSPPSIGSTLRLCSSTNEAAPL